MRHTTLFLLVVAALAGCTGEDGGLGASCDTHDDCKSDYQCLNDICVDRCDRSPECGDGFECDEGGICRISEGQLGDACRAETDCGPGLSCQIDGTEVDSENRLRASCTSSFTKSRPAGAECFADGDCRNGTCAMGHCVDLCSKTRDCSVGNTCMVVPRVEAFGSLFGGCLPTAGNITWTIPVVAPMPALLFPVPSEASYASLIFEVEDPLQKVGATRVAAPSGEILYTKCIPSTAGQCTVAEEDAQYYANAVRHAPEAGLSVLAMPSNPEVELETGVYYVIASSFRPNGTESTTIPKVRAVVRIGSGGSLDLNLHFLDLTDHPCQSSFNNMKLDAATASTQTFFRQDFLDQLRSIFTRGGISFGSITYTDLSNHPALDGLDISNAGALLSLGKQGKGINVFFVRTLSPVGLQAFGPGPGPAGVGGTRKSGIVIGVDTLCYRSWPELARLTAHEIARYMGLHHNVEVDMRWRDPIFDSDDTEANLMFYSELGGTDLSPGQLEILTKSPVLR